MLVAGEALLAANKETRSSHCGLTGGRLVALVLMVRCKNEACRALFQSLLQFDPVSFSSVEFLPQRYRCPRCRETHVYTREDHSHVEYRQARAQAAGLG